MKVEHPAMIATEHLLWLRKDGTEVPIQAGLGLPYERGGAWACPVVLSGVDENYSDIMGDSSMQALQLALRLIRQRLGHLLETGEALVYPDERDSRWDIDCLNAVFGRE